MLAIFKKQKNWPLVIKIAKEVKKAGGRTLVIGGSVRDALLRQQEIKDFDLEVYGLDAKTLKRVLARLGKVREFGRQFGVYNLKGIDIALPRTDSRTKPGLGRKPKVVSQPDLDFKQASSRRDLTINALAYDPLTGKVLDAHGGLADLRRGILRAVDPASFGDDPLRVLRVMQFSGRFGFKIDPKTVKLCQGINLNHLAKERIGEEWKKLLLKSPKPSVGLEAGRQLVILKKIHPMLSRLSPSAWKKVKQGVDGLAGSNEVLIYTSIARALKPDARHKFLVGVNLPQAQTKAVEVLSDLNDEFHDTDDFARLAAFKLSKVGLTLKDLIKILDDNRSRRLSVRAARLNLFKNYPKPLLEGRDLIKLGVEPGKKMGELLKSAFKHQLKGEFDNAHHRPKKDLALKWMKSQL
jgi:tRNA nucleotidyltransferase (CCA-adding enzyme)